MHVIDEQGRYWCFWWAEEREGGITGTYEMRAWLTLSRLVTQPGRSTCR